MGKIVLDIGGTKLRWALWKDQGLHHIQESPTPHLGAHDFVDHLVHLLRPYLQQYQVQELGVASAGPIQTHTGELLGATNLGNGDSSWQRFRLQEELSKKTNTIVSIGNDAAAAALGQFYYVEKQSTADLVVVTLGTGLGVGAIVQGILVEGGQGLHPEVGHMILGPLEESLYSTALGNFPTAESFLAGHHFAKRVSLDLKSDVNGKTLIQLSQQGDPRLHKHWTNYRITMASFLANLYLLYFPKRIVLGGGFAVAAAPYFLEETRKLLTQLLLKQFKAGVKQPAVELSREAELLPLYGAAYL